jgi:prevent-host-death family protein
MTEVTTAELRAHLSEIINRVAYGNETVTITRHGKTLAVIAPPITDYVESLLAQRKPVAPEVVRDISGKYRDVPYKVADFLRDKQDEIEREG